MPATRQECQALLDAMDRDDAEPAGDRAVGEILARLQVHYWRPDFAPEQAASLYADMMEDLAHYPKGLLIEAAADYRQDPAAKFFPRSGDLIGRIDAANRRRVRARFNIKRALAEPESHQETQLPTKDRRKELADMARKTVRGFTPEEITP